MTTAGPATPTHRLVTTATGCTGDPASRGYHHNCYSVAAWMPPPDTSGAPAFTPLWSHILTAP